ncbi:uncharacterized protein BO80DRAFT_120087 [Aspergillus ibericus CBS 121593]|uniref:Fungal N-terminal domain-containing protein n=1 Tax=Aspergillus ibericus CBS 121593 TaxID=1448316 RepID=A0A395GW24_9EURO|nr:hypothetical protein BO80DRAFT_120087 [Aspergillus ibericus CBS 121593]RAK99622.1 hypothetical protein BO80DRAFT_120087 [Aspergillus ibericus CBS 121593]
MTDPVGLASSVLALGGFLITLLEFANEIKDSSEDLRRYHTVLETIRRTTDLMAYFAGQSESIKNLETIVNGRKENLVRFCARSIRLLISDVEKLTSTLTHYYGNKSQKSKATKEILRRIREVFKGARSSSTFVLNRNHINDLIQAAKHIESSLHYALSTILLARNEFKTDETQILINNMNDSITSHFNQFEAWCEAFQQSNPSVIYVKAKHERQSPAKRSSQPLIVKTRTGKNKQCITREYSGGSTPTSCSLLEQQDTSLIHISSQSCGSVGSTEWEDCSETLAVIRNDGAFHPSQYIAQFPISIQGPHSEVEEGQDHTSSSEVQYQISNGNTTDDAVFSQSEYFPVTTDDEGSTYSSAIYDSEELDIDPNVEAFIDGAVTIANCVSGDNNCLEFCVRTMIIHDSESPVLILKEPCRSSTCRHISLYAQGGLRAEHPTPCYLQVLLRENQVSEAPESSSSHDHCLKVFTTSHRDKTQKGNTTLILGQIGRFKQYAVPTSFSADVFTEKEDESEESDHSETSSNASTILDEDRQEETSEVPPQDPTVTEELPFSSLPCLFCREDALRPRLSAGGVQALLFLQNNSFGYTCERCNERTWVSAMRYGLTGVGASWAFW